MKRDSISAGLSKLRLLENMNEILTQGLERFDRWRRGIVPRGMGDIRKRLTQAEGELLNCTDPHERDMLRREINKHRRTIAEL
jgi:hypothetical protein